MLLVVSPLRRFACTELCVVMTPCGAMYIPRSITVDGEDDVGNGEQSLLSQGGAADSTDRYAFTVS